MVFHVFYLLFEIYYFVSLVLLRVLCLGLIALQGTLDLGFVAGAEVHGCHVAEVVDKVLLAGTVEEALVLGAETDAIR